MIVEASGVAQPAGFTANSPVMTMIMQSMDDLHRERRRPYAVMLPKTTQETIEAEVGLPVLGDNTAPTIFGLEIIPCSRLPLSQPFVILFD